MIDDVLVELLTALERHGVIASGQDAEGYAITLQCLSEMQDAGWKFTAPTAEPVTLERVLEAIRHPGTLVPSESEPPHYAEPRARWQARAVMALLRLSRRR